MICIMFPACRAVSEYRFETPRVYTTKEITMSLVKTTGLSFTILVAVTSIGCSYAKKDDIASLRRELAEVRRISETSLVTAKEAQITANNAQGIAETTSVRSTTTEEQLNRVFKKSMQK